MDLAQAVLDGSRLAIARLLTQVENNTTEGREAINTLFRHTGRAYLIGVTGAPGTGKSSLVNQLARHFRGMAEPLKVAIVAVDPSSPFSGGAILGDRVRMRDLSGDPGVFIRSMASRGSLGGLAAATAGVVQVLDAAGFDVILIETVGAGQAEVDIARLAHTTLVIEAPGLGDDIQAIKAGILEIADVLVINKADRPGVDVTERALKSMLQLAHPGPRVFQNHAQAKWAGEPLAKDQATPQKEIPLWIPPIRKTIATEGQGLTELLAAIVAHRQYLEASGEWQRRDHARLQSELDLLLRETLVARWKKTVPESAYHQALHELVDRDISPWQAVRSLLDLSG